MSIFSNILAKIFPASHPATQSSASAPARSPPTAPSTPRTPAQAATASLPPVDVEKILDDRARQNPEKLNWKTSIVDLMKLLGLDSSLSARKALAQELHYTGDMSDSAAMNIWLHRQVMKELEANGGKVPESLKS